MTTVGGTPVTAALEDLKACKDAVEQYKRILLENEEITKRNAEKTAQYRAAHSAWAIRKKSNEDAQASWDARKTQIFNGNQESREWNACVASWEADAGKHDDWCRNDFGHGWFHSGKTGYRCGLQNKGICSKTDEKRWQEATAQVTAERGARPANFNEPEPRDREGIYAYDPQVQNDGQVQCCANILNINVGDANNVKQTCSQQIQIAIDNYAAAPPPAPVGTGPAPLDSTPSPALSQNNQSTDSPDRMDNLVNKIKENQKVVGGSISLIILCSMIILSIILLMFNDSGN